MFQKKMLSRCLFLIAVICAATAIPVWAAPNLSIEVVQTDPPPSTPISNCQNASFEIRLTNSGEHDAVDVDITSTMLAAGFTFVSSSPSLENQTVPADGIPYVWAVVYHAGCDARSGDLETRVTYSDQEGNTYPPLLPSDLAVTVGPGAITITKVATHVNGGELSPYVSEPEAELGETITWRIRVENTGLGSVSNVVVTDTIGAGLTQTSSGGPSYTVGEIPKDGESDITVVTQVVSCEDLTSSVSARWGCDLTTDCKKPVSANASVSLIQKYPLLAIAPDDVRFSVPYCHSSNVTQPVTVQIENTREGIAENVALKVSFGSDFSVSNITPSSVSYDGVRFTGLGNINGESTISLHFDLTYTPPSNWCESEDAGKSGTFLWEPEYNDACDLVYEPTMAESTFTIDNANVPKPAVEVTKTCEVSSDGVNWNPLGPVLEVRNDAQEVRCNVSVTYTGPVSCGSGASGDLTISDAFPAEWTMTSLSGINGTSSPGLSSPIPNPAVWTVDPSSSASWEYTASFTVPPVGGGIDASCGQERTNAITVTGTDCCGCQINPDSTPNASVTTTIDCQHPGTSGCSVAAVSSTWPDAPAGYEVCSELFYSHTYQFNGNDWDSILWSDAGIVFTQERNNHLSLLSNIVVSVKLPPDDDTCEPVFASANPDTGQTTLTVTGNGTCGANVGNGTQLTISYNLSSTKDSSPQCGDTATFQNTAILDTACTSSANRIVDVESIKLNGSDMSVSVDWEGDAPSTVGPCGDYNVEITVHRESTAPVYDAILYMDREDYEEIEITSIDGGWGGGPEPTPVKIENGTWLEWSPGDPPDDKVGYVWNFDGWFSGSNNEVVIHAALQARCVEETAELNVHLGFNSKCNDPDSDLNYASRSCQRDAEISSAIRKPKLSVYKFPEKIFANGILGQPGYTPAKWTISVVNSGAGSAYNVQIIEELDSDLTYQSGTWNKSSDVTTFEGTYPDGTTLHGVSYIIAEMEPGEVRTLTFTADILGCHESTNTVTARIYCNGEGCQSVFKESEVLFPPTDLVVTTEFNNKGTTCALRKIKLAAKNAGLTPVRNIRLDQILPDELDYILDTSEYRITSLSSPNPLWTAATNPDIPSGSPVTLTWAYDSASLGPEVFKNKLGLLLPGEKIEIQFDAFVDCEFGGGDLESTAEFSECSGEERVTTTSGSFRMNQNKPLLVAEMEPLNPEITCDKEFIWTLVVRNNSPAGSGANADYLRLKDTLGPGFPGGSVEIFPEGESTAVLDLDLDGNPQSIEWEVTPQTDPSNPEVYLPALAPQQELRYEIRATLTNGACAGNVTNQFIAKGGCYSADGPTCFICNAGDSGDPPDPDEPQCPDSNGTAANEPPTLEVALGQTTLSACQNDQTVTIRLTNTSTFATISEPSLALTLPSGVTHRGTAFITPPGGGTPVEVTIDDVPAGPVNFGDGAGTPANTIPNIPPDDDDPNNNNNVVVISFPVDVQCAAGGNFTADTSFEDCCGTSIEPADTTLSPTWNSPTLSVDVTNNGGPFDCGEDINWTVTVENTGSADAKMITLDAFLGGGLTAPALIGTGPAYTSLEFYEVDASGTQIGSPLFLFDSSVTPKKMSWEIANLNQGSSRRYRIITSADSTNCLDELSRTLQVVARWHCTSTQANEDPSDPSESTCQAADTDPRSLVADVEPNVSASASIEAGTIGYCNRNKEVTATFTTDSNSNTIYNLQATVTLPNQSPGGDPQNGILRFVGGEGTLTVSPGDGNHASGLANSTDNINGSVTIAPGTMTAAFAIADQVEPDTAITVKFQVNSSCFREGDINVEFTFQDCCQNGSPDSGHHSATSSQRVAADNPSLEITTLTRTPADPPSGPGPLSYALTVTNNGTFAMYGRIAVHLTGWMQLQSASDPVLTDSNSGAVAPESTGHGCVADPELDIDPPCGCAANASDTWLVWDVKDLDNGDTWSTTIQVNFTPPAVGSDCNDDHTRLEVVTYYDCPDVPASWDTTWNNSPCSNETGTGCDLTQSGSAVNEFEFCASIGNLVWYDQNGDGIQNEAPAAFGVNGVTVNLYASGSPATPLQTVNTSSNGAYLFDGLIPGDYYIQISPPSPYIITGIDQGSGTTQDEMDSDADPSSGQTSVTTLGPGEDDITWDAGIYMADFGDLPNSYPTLLTQNGPRHIRPFAGDGSRMGSLVDTEANGAPSSAADGDGAEEDGVTFNTPIMPGQPYTITVNASAAGWLNAWIDFNGDGDFDEPGEWIVTNQPLNAGGNTLSLTAPPAPAGSFPTTLYSRFRYTAGNSDGGGSPTGMAASGEVEDYALMSLGDTVWLDNGEGTGGTSNNGIKDGSEPGIPGVTVELYADGQATPIATAVTDASGAYLFTGLTAGSYRVHIPSSQFAAGGALEGHLSSNDTTTGGADPENNTNNDDNGVDNAAPAANGITSLPISLALGTEPTNDGDSDANSNRTLDFGFYMPVGLGGTLWRDQNNNALVDTGEPSLGDGIPVYLFREGVTPAGDLSNAEATVNTDTDGTYRFSGLNPGRYFVYIPNPPAGYPESSSSVTGEDQDDGENDDDNGIQAASGGPVSSPVVTLQEGTEPDTDTDGDGTSSDMTIDFGFFSRLTLGNRIWWDRNDNGIYDPSDPDAPENGIDGVTVNLYAEGAVIGADSPLQTTTTASITPGDGGGLYQFTGLLPGNYFVHIPKENFDVGGALEHKMSSTPPADDPDNDEDDTDDENGLNNTVPATEGVRSGVITLASGTEPITDTDTDPNTNLTLDFGFYDPMTLGNLVWFDRDNDGIYESSDPGAPENGIDGVTVNLYAEGQAISTPPIATATTHDNGQYTFTGLEPGNYFVHIPAGQFTGTGPLAGYFSTVPTEADPDNNANENVDENGLNIGVPATAGVSSGVITLISGTEPTNGNRDGDTNLTLDFGFCKPMSLGDRVWHDVNGNGLQDDPADEPGLAATLTLYRTEDNGVTRIPAQDIYGNNVDDIESTDGSFLFTGLPPGDYIVDVVLDTPATFIPTVGYPVPGTIADPDDNDAPDDSNIEEHAVRLRYETLPVTLISDNEPVNDGDVDPNTNRTVDAGFFEPLSVGHRIWLDANGNGVQDPGESGAGEAEVKLMRTTDGGLTWIPATDVNGDLVPSQTLEENYLFTNLPPGEYRIEVTPPAGCRLSPGGADPDDNTSTTDSNGVMDGTSMVTPAFFLSSGEEPDVDVDGDGPNSNRTVDIGLFYPLTLGDFIWRDTNGDGVRDATDADGHQDVGEGECGLPGAKVELLDGATLNPAADADGNPVSPVTTGTDGRYSFPNLRPGDYVVRVTPPEDYYSTKDGTVIDPDDNSSNADDNGVGTEAIVVSLPVTLKSNGEPTDDGDDDPNTNLSLDFGFYPALSLGNRLWFDYNFNGLLDGAEPGVPGVPVHLKNEDGTPALDIGGSAVTTVTDAQGYYRFDRLVPGRYTVAIPAAAFGSGGILENYISTQVTEADPNTNVDLDDNGLDGTAPAIGGVVSDVVELTPDAQPTGETDVQAGSTNADGPGELDDDNTHLAVDFGFVPVLPGAVGDHVWLDTNGDGIQDVGETGIPNVRLRLYDDDGRLVAEEMTNSNGDYLFTGVFPGNYTVEIVEEDIPPGLTNSHTPATAVTITPGQEIRDVDFGYKPTGAMIGDTVWHDVDGDGVEDPGEPGIGGVVLNLVSPGPDNILGTEDDVVEAATTTNASGIYYFTDVPAGEYWVDVADANFSGTGALAGYTLTGGSDPSTPIEVAAGDVYLKADFGYQNTGPGLHSIEDTFWRDPDGSGTMEDTEFPIPNVTVDLVTPGPDGEFGTDDDAVVASTTSDANGDVRFEGLPDGDYRIVVTDIHNELTAVFGTTPPGVAGYRDVTLNGADIDEENFGYRGNGMIGDTVFIDADGDGIQDPGEAGIGGVTVTLWKDPNGDGNFSDVVKALETITGPDGKYLFTGICKGLYYVSIDGGIPAGLSLTTGDEIPGIAGDQMISEIESCVGRDLTRDFGYKSDSPLPSISGSIWNDLDRSGTDNGPPETPISGVTVVLLNSSGEIVAKTVTDGNGDYQFPGVLPGGYTVHVTDDDGVLDGYELTGDGTGPWGNGPSSGQQPNEYKIDVGDANITGLDFGYVVEPETGAIGDRIWQDTNADRIQDDPAVEPGISGVEVVLYNDLNVNGIVDSGDTEVARMNTGNDGAYLFEELPAGNYIVDVTESTVPEGFILTTANDPYRVNLSDDERYLLADFGYQPRAEVYGRVFEDENGNGVQDPGEPPLTGVTVEVTDSLGHVHVLTTDENGDWRVDIPAGATGIDVKESMLPPGMVQTAGTDPQTVDVPAGSVTHGGDDGYRQENAAIGDYVWYDTNGDAVPDASETGVPNVTLTLYRDTNADGVLDAGSDPEIATTITDANGFYQFDGLPEGAYLVQVTPSAELIAGQYVLSGGIANPHPVTLARGEHYTDADFGYEYEAQTVTATKTDTAENGEPARAGEEILYEITLRNPGNFRVMNAEFRDFIPCHTTFVQGSLIPPAGAAVLSESPEIRITGISLPAGTDVHLSFRVTIDNPLPAGVTEIENQGTVYYDSSGDGVNNAHADTDGDPDEPGEQPVYTPVTGGSAALGDTVWHDVNADGIQDAGETGMAGVLVRLEDGGGNLLAEQYTNADGNYLFENLTPGDYRVVFAAPDGWVFGPADAGGADAFDSDADANGRTPVVTLAEGEDNRNMDAGLHQPGQPGKSAALGDKVWWDVNKDGVQDGSEPGLSGVTVHLLDAAGSRISTDTTDGLGQYLFEGLPAGDYRIEIELPADMALSPADAPAAGSDEADSDISPADNRSPVVSLSDGERRLDVDAGLYHTEGASPASLGDFVWHDLNGDKVQSAGEEGVPGVTVRLLSADGLTLLAGTTTDSEGRYLFSGLSAGDYVVEFVTPAGLEFVDRFQGGDAALDSDADPVTGRVLVSLAAGENRTDVDAGLTAPAAETIRLGDLVWLDGDNNGVADPGEGLSGVEVRLYDADTGLVVRTDITDANGHYEFPDLPPGRSWRVELNPGTFPDGTAVFVDPDGVMDGRTDVWNQTGNNLDLDFGLRAVDIISIGDQVWEDKNNNGSPDAGEGIPGVRLVLKNGAGVPVDEILTDADGRYVFSGLASGDWTVAVDPATLPADLTPFTDYDGGNDHTATAVNQHTDNMDLDFGYRPSSGGGGGSPLAVLGDRVWEDRNQDGVQDPGEPGVSGVPVQLCAGDGTTVLGETLTDAQGYYRFAGLNPGAYVVVFHPFDGWTISPPDAGGDTKDSDANPSTGRSPVISLAAGQWNLTVDAGVYPPRLIDIGDLVFRDENGNGVADPGEGIPGVRLLLFNGTNTLTAETQTDAQGRYLFPDLPPGDWRVVVDPATLPPGLVMSYDPDGIRDGAVNLPGLTSDYLDADFGYRPVNPESDLSATKTAVDLNGPPLERGDVIRYTVTLYNAGAAPAENLVFTDDPDPYTGLVSGSVMTTLGTVVSGGEQAVIVQLGDMAPGETARITYDVRVSDAAPPCARIENQGWARPEGGSAVPTDFPDTPAPDDPTVAGPLDGEYSNARVTARKSSEDLNGGSLEPGDTLRYKIQIENAGPDAVKNLVFEDRIPSGTTLVDSSAAANAGTFTELGPVVRLALDRLGSGESVTVRFDVKLDDDLTAGALILNQGVVTADCGILISTGDAGATGGEDPTVNPVGGGDPAITAWKTVQDLNGEAVAPGDLLEYVITVENNGTATATGLRVTDAPAASLSLVPGTVSNSAGQVIRGNGAGDDRVVVELDALAPGGRLQIRFQAEIPSTAADGAVVPNQGRVNADGLPEIPTDDPATEEKNDPTVVVVTDRGFLPPTPGKSGQWQWPEARWTVTLDNDRNAGAMLAHAEDPLPEDAVWIAGSLESSAGQVWYDAEAHSVVWEGVIPGGGRISFSFSVRYRENETKEEIARRKNRICVYWDENGSNDWRDEAQNEIGPVCQEAEIETPGPDCEIRLGDQVWVDLDASGDCAGDLDEFPNGVRVNLYADTDGNNSFTPGVDLLLESTFTGVIDGRGGRYLFDGLTPGAYIVQLDPSAFEKDGPLHGLLSLDGASDPDDNRNSDDNGYLLEGYGAVAHAVRLDCGDEPVSDNEPGISEDGRDDADGNLTVDFGFYRPAAPDEPRPDPDEPCPDCDVPLKPF